MTKTRGLTDREWQILYACYKYYYLTADQLTRLYFGNSLNYVRAICREFVRMAYLQEVLMRRTGRGGSSPGVFTLAWRGWNEVAARGHERRRYRPSEQHEQDERNLSHTLAVNEHFIAAEHLTRSELPVRLEALVHERDFRRMKLAIEPDGWMDFRMTDTDPEEQQVVMLELDQDSQDEKVIAGKVTRYLSYLPGKYRQDFDTIYGRVLFATTKEDKRADELLRWIEKLTTPDTGQWFLVTADLPQQYREQYFYEQIARQPHGKELTSILV